VTHTNLPDQWGRLPGTSAWLLAGLWLGTTLILAERGYLAPSRGLPFALLACIIAPQVGFWLCYLFVGRFRKYVLELDMTFLVSVQSWRVVGLALFFLWSYGLLRGGFAVPAAIGDIIVGVAAVFVGLRVARRQSGWQRHVIALSVLGLGDFVFAIWAANFAGPLSFDPPPADASLVTGILTRLPLAVIPAFLVPAFSLAHYAALAQLLRRPS
jgi:hypothetical protein